MTGRLLPESVSFPGRSVDLQDQFTCLAEDRLRMDIPHLVDEQRADRIQNHQAAFTMLHCSRWNEKDRYVNFRYLNLLVPAECTDLRYTRAGIDLKQGSVP